MSFVGPRPHVRRQLCNTAGQYHVLKLRPGVTSPATLHFRNQEKLLHGIAADVVESYHSTHIMPRKIRLELLYARRATLKSDLQVMLQTVREVIKPPRNSIFLVPGFSNTSLKDD